MKKANSYLRSVVTGMVLVLVFLHTYYNWEKIYLIMTTNLPPVSMVKDFEKHIECARKVGFKFNPPLLRVEKQSLKELRDLGTIPLPPDGTAYPWFNMIILFPDTADWVMGHELGHIIDYQTNRKGHPIFSKIKNLKDQDFANAVGAVIAKCELVG